MDLLGRKVTMKDGAAFKLYLAEIRKTMEQARTIAELQPLASQLDDALSALERVTAHLLGLAGSAGTERFLADATLYLEQFGVVTMGWQWLKQGLTVQSKLQASPSANDAAFYQGKLAAMRYFFAYELPKTLSLSSILMADNALTVELDSKILG
jgi:butyryl-CoA dehydrogenase